MQESDYQALIELAIAEDLGTEGDVTSLAVIPGGERTAVLWSKDQGVLAGEAVFTAVFRRIDPGVTVTFHFHDGSALAKGDRVAEVRGPVPSLLSVNPEVTPEAASLVSRMMAKERKHRPASMWECIKELRGMKYFKPKIGPRVDPNKSSNF